MLNPLEIPLRLLVLMPVYEDWASAAEVCRRIDSSFPASWPVELHVILLNDGSRTPYQPAFDSIRLNVVADISVLELHRNLGHQRAIAIGLAYVAANLSADGVLVMDADGEDPPEQIPELIREAEQQRLSVVVFAERGRRVEGWLFQVFYFFYRVLHSLLTGRKIRVGNFSFLPWKLLQSLITYPELWNHYAAAVLQSRLPRAMTRLDRGARIQGKSKMGFVDLVMHGMSALFAYHDLVSTRLLFGNFILILISGAIVLALMAGRGIAALNTPGTAAIAILVIVGQFSTLSLLAIFLAVMNRSSYQFLPARDYVHFVRGLFRIAGRQPGDSNARQTPIIENDAPR
jgi:polyisoprenyl-phosphate glycosyltransferase